MSTLYGDEHGYTECDEVADALRANCKGLPRFADVEECASWVRLMGYDPSPVAIANVAERLFSTQPAVSS
jgi:hypothetical protein